ncbi:MAG: 3-oxoacyl-ACP reductase FabG [Candidatus Marsarchaeota archaeon]|nr:3-oxoacyl-ACP reductase FabG [Candidatus Marsarchaeota archaeon]
MAKLDGSVAIVTGSGNGIGRAIANRFAAEGAKVVIADMDPAAAERVAAEIASSGGLALPVAVDVASSTQVKSMASQALRQFGQIDILVNNAGICPLRSFWEITEDEWDRVVDVNLKGTFLCSQTVAGHMRERKRGKIVNVSSVTYLMAPPERSHYIAAKGGVIGLTRAMARELGPHSINVNAIAPGPTKTETALAERTEEAFAEYRQARAIQRDEYPVDLVGAAVFFASQDSDMITGQTLLVDGGRYFM